MSQQSDLRPLWEAGDYAPPTLTVSELSGSLGDDDQCLKVMVNRSKGYRDMLQRMRNALGRVFLHEFWAKRPDASGRP